MYIYEYKCIYMNINIYIYIHTHTHILPIDRHKVLWKKKWTKLAKQTWQHIKKYNILWHSRTYKTLVYCGIIKMKVRWISYLKPIKQIKHIRIKWVVNISAQNKYYILRYFWALVCSKVEAKQETTILINRDVTPYRLGLPYQ